MSDGQKSALFWVVVIGLIGVGIWWFNYSDHAKEASDEQLRRAADAVSGGRQPVRHREVIVNGHRGHYEYLDNPAWPPYEPYPAPPPYPPRREFVDDDLQQYVATDPDGQQHVLFLGGGER